MVESISSNQHKLRVACRTFYDKTIRLTTV